MDASSCASRPKRWLRYVRQRKSASRSVPALANRSTAQARSFAWIRHRDRPDRLQRWLNGLRCDAIAAGILALWLVLGRGSGAARVLPPRLVGRLSSCATRAFARGRAVRFDFVIMNGSRTGETVLAAVSTHHGGEFLSVQGGEICGHCPRSRSTISWPHLGQSSDFFGGSTHSTWGQNVHAKRRAFDGCSHQTIR